MKLLTDILRNIVPQIGNKFTKEVFFYAGTYQEVTNELTSLIEAPSTAERRYPFVWLVVPYKEDFGGQWLPGYKASDVKLIIAEETKQNMTTLERIDTIFKPLLIPICDELFRLMWMSGEFDMEPPAMIKHTRTLFPYWGTLEGGGRKANIFNDFVDVIEISNLDLIINKIC